MKDFVINSDLINEWNWEKNNELGLYPDQITLGSGKRAWWICNKGHEWQAAVCSRADGRGCPYCSNRVILIGFNDLNTVNAKLASEWNYQKNNGLTPEMVTSSSSKVVWWICNQGHEWKRRIANRNAGSGCPYCADYYIWPGYNDLVTTRPDLALEWNYEKNDDLLPTQVSRGYGHKVWWKCGHGHEWEASPNSRDNMDSGCPACSKGNHISIQETIIYFYIKKYFDDAIHSYHNKNVGITEIDVFIPSLQIGIEYDGHYWHQDIEKDKKKDIICENNNIKLIRIRDVGCPNYESSCEFVYLSKRTMVELGQICEKLLNRFGIINPFIDIERDIDEIKKIRDLSLCKNNAK